MAKVIYKGASALNGAPVRAILTEDSENDKTGRMAQLFILPDAEAPHNAQRTGGDASVCECALSGPRLVADATLYLPRSAFNLEGNGKQGRCRRGRDVRELDPSVRLGAYGDPAALPST